MVIALLTIIIIYMLHDNVRSALNLLTPHEQQGVPLSLNKPVSPDNPSWMNSVGRHASSDVLIPPPHFIQLYLMLHALYNSFSYTSN